MREALRPQERRLAWEVPSLQVPVGAVRRRRTDSDTCFIARPEQEGTFGAGDGADLAEAGGALPLAAAG
jgi:hypothetical protein